jgi:predicted PurR-regulated permease PerM
LANATRSGLHWSQVQDGRLEEHMSADSIGAGRGVPGRGYSDAPAGTPTRVRRVRAAAAARGIPLATIVTSIAVVVLTFLAGKLLYRLRDVLLLIFVAGFIALILNPLVIYVQRWVPRRGWAVTIVTLWAALVFVGLVLAFGYPLVTGFTHLAHRLPLYVRDAAAGHGWIGHLARRFHLEAWAARNAPKLESLGASLAKPALNLGKGAVSLLATLATIVALVLLLLLLLLLLEGPKMRRGVLAAMSPERAPRYSRVAHEINQSVTGYVLGDLLASLIAGVVIFVALAALRVPFPLLWALWVALVDFLPMIGGALAGIPTVLFAAGHSLTAGIITAAVFIGYQQLENHVLNPVVMSKTVKVNPPLILVAILIGSSIGDWLGGTFGAFVAALLSIPCAAALQVITRELWQATAPGGTLSSEPGPGPLPPDLTQHPPLVKGS